MSFLTIIILSLSALAFLTTLEAKIESTNPKPKLLKLIYVDSIHSPFFDKNATLLQRSRNALRNSRLRAISLNARNITFTTEAQNQGLSFLVWLKIGYPPVDQFLSVDTGTSLSWVFCPPCNSCNYQSNALYDPKNSELSATLGCDAFCRYEVPFQSCRDGTCHYHNYYGKFYSSTGVIVKDTIYDPMERIGRAYFGCSERSTLAGNFSGLFGLGMGQMSFLSQWGYTKFSYCFNNISNVLDSDSALVMGEIYDIPSYSTPFRTDTVHYYVFPLHISFGGEYLHVDLKFLSTYGIILDTSATQTYLPPNVVIAIEGAVEKYMDGKLQITFSRSYRLCYIGVLTRDIPDFPSLTIHLAEAVDIVLGKENLFYQVTKRMFCLYITPSIAQGTDAIGIVAQQRHFVSYDLVARRIKIRQYDCVKVNEKA